MATTVTGVSAARVWEQADDALPVRLRRIAFFGTVITLTVLACVFMADVLWESGVNPVWIVLQLIPFAILSGALALSFCQAVIGMFLLSASGDHRRISRTVDWRNDHFTLHGKTAIAIPIFNEDVREVFRRIGVMRRSLDATGRGSNFDFFVLSDSNDPNKWIEEELAWNSLHKGTMVHGNRIFYRRRRHPQNNKSGNMADFCRRWGGKYRHMIVLDADSFMTGGTMVALARLMEENPNAGIIQTVPKLMGAKTVFARAMQFAASLYSPALAAGANFWQQGDANFWGHNAIIRLAPFINHCALPKLPGTDAFGGRILSHDFVEAALMRKAGWSVWCAYDLKGSYEGTPPTMLDYLARDRRWCQGNMQHARLLFARGIRPLNRLHFLMGVLAYTASPLLVLFILIGLVASFTASQTVPGALMLFAGTMLFIFGFKLTGFMALLSTPSRARAYGGIFRATASAVVETVISFLIAPIFLWYHTKFVLFTLAGKKITWGTQDRGGNGGLSWRAAAREHTFQTFTGIVLASTLAFFSPGLLAWFAPLLLGLVLSIPISVWSSRDIVRRGKPGAGVFFVPEELNPQPVLKHLQAHIERDEENEEAESQRRSSVDTALTRAVIDPFTNAVHLSLLRDKAHRNPALDSLCRRLLRLGPDSLTVAWKRALLSDRQSLTWLHRKLWLTPAYRLPDWWRIARRQIADAPSQR